MKISKEIGKVAEANKIPIETLALEQVKRVKDNIYEKYSNNSKSAFLWEDFVDFSVVNNKDGWALIADFVDDKECLMFFDDREDKSVLQINGGKDLYKILIEMYGFEFYITNFMTEYLICFNHHDCLMGCGTAKNWVNTLKN